MLSLVDHLSLGKGIMSGPQSLAFNTPFFFSHSKTQGQGKVKSGITSEAIQRDISPEEGLRNEGKQRLIGLSLARKKE